MSTLSMAHSGEAAGSGSSAMTSSAAPLICRRASTSTRAGSSTTRPRAALSRYADGSMSNALASCASDQQRLAAEFVLSLREVTDHTAPDPFCLVVARLGQPARERQHQCHDVLGDRAGINAAGAREPHVVLLEQLARELVGAGTDRLDETQPLRARQEIVAPEARDHQHVGLADPLLERGAVAHLEALDAGRERQEALAQPIGNMRKANRQLVLGREHEVTPEFVGYADNSADRLDAMGLSDDA